MTGVKSIKTKREFEKTLRDAGFSQTEAKAITAEGFAGFAGHRDDVAADEPDTNALTGVLDQLRQLQESLSHART